MKVRITETKVTMDTAQASQPKPDQRNVMPRENKLIRTGVGIILQMQIEFVSMQKQNSWKAKIQITINKFNWQSTWSAKLNESSYER